MIKISCKIFFAISLTFIITNSLLSLTESPDNLLIAKIFDKYITEPTSVIEPSAHEELTLIPSGTCRSALSEKIDRTTTIFGKEAFKNILINPTTDITKITNRQVCISKISSDFKLLSCLEKELNSIKLS